MTIEELTFAAFQQGREQGREESAAQIERLREALEEVVKAEKHFSSTITTSQKVQVLISAKALRLARAALQIEKSKK
jgi:hypothetical protein